MPWFKVDDGFHEHAKVEALEVDPLEHAVAIAAWTLLGTACARRLTDGVVTRAVLAKVLVSWPERQRLRAANALVRVGLWDAHEDGWRFHDWHDRNPSRDDVVREREAAAERKRKSRGGGGSSGGGGHGPGHSVGHSVGHGVTPPVTPAVTATVTPGGVTVDPGSTRAPARACAPAIPTRPDPTRPDRRESESARDAFDSQQARVEAARSELVRAYAERYQRETNDAWMSASGQADRISAVAVWCASTSDPVDAARRVVDGAFATERWARHRWPWKYIAEDPAACAAASTIAHTSTPASLAGIPRIEVPA